MRTRKTDFFCVRLKPAEFNKLEQLAKETDRSKGAIIRRLLAIADMPETRQLLEAPQNEAINEQ